MALSQGDDGFVIVVFPGQTHFLTFEPYPTYLLLMLITPLTKLRNSKYRSKTRYTYNT